MVLGKDAKSDSNSQDIRCRVGWRLQGIRFGTQTRIMDLCDMRKAPTDVVNARNLDTSVRDVTEGPSSEKEADMLIHTMNLLKQSSESA